MFLFISNTNASGSSHRRCVYVTVGLVSIPLQPDADVVVLTRAVDERGEETDRTIAGLWRRYVVCAHVSYRSQQTCGR
jgi:hypothetical protein